MTRFPALEGKEVVAVLEPFGFSVELTRDDFLKDKKRKKKS